MLAWGGRNWILGTLLLSTICLTVYLLIPIFILLLLSIIFLVLDIFFLGFFRDPERIIATGVVSPADGRVFQIKSYQSKANGQVKIHIAIFMSPFNVHVNRAPIAGRVLSMVHRPGGFVPAYKQESKYNERVITKMSSSIGEITIIQIAGILAKRIVSYIKKNQVLVKGQRIGIIQFGSRVDIILSRNRIKLTTKVGEHVKAGISTLAIIKND